MVVLGEMESITNSRTMAGAKAATSETLKRSWEKRA